MLHISGKNRPEGSQQDGKWWRRIITQHCVRKSAFTVLAKKMSENRKESLNRFTDFLWVPLIYFYRVGGGDRLTVDGGKIWKVEKKEPSRVIVIVSGGIFSRNLKVHHYLGHS